MTGAGTSTRILPEGASTGLLAGTGPIRLLLVDDTPTVHQTLVAMLNRRAARRASARPYAVDLVQTVQDAIDAIRAGRHDCYLVDHHVGRASGVEMIRSLRAEGVNVPIIMLTGAGTMEDEAARAGANDFLVKGAFDTPALERAIRYAIGNADALRRLAQLNQSLEAQVAERTRRLWETNERLLEQIAARERAEAALRRASTLEALGRMTGLVAHDFNNVLTALFASLEMLETRLGPAADPRLLRPLATARGAAVRGERMMDGLLAFARRRPVAPQRLDVNEVIGAAGEVLRVASGNVPIRLDLAHNLPPIEADLDQLERAMVNLVTNARDALGGRVDGTITIATARDGEHVHLSVGDNGAGMSDEVLARAFEPLFSTKEEGRGTGLGLAQVYGFVQSSAGSVTIDNRPGEGVTIVMRLPAKRTDAPG